VSAPAPDWPATRACGGAALAAAAFLMPGLAVYAPLGVAPLFTVAAVVVLVCDGRRAPAWLRDLAPLAWLLAALSLWAAASAAWSILPLHSLLEGVRLLALSAGGVLLLGAARALDPRQRALLGIAAIAGTALGAALLLIEGASGAALLRLFLPRGEAVPMTRFDRGSTVLVLSLWPAALALGRRALLGALLLAVAAAAVLLIPSAAARLALVLAAAAFLVALAWPRLVAGALMAAIVLFAAALPPALPKDRDVVVLHEAAPWVKFSGIHRMMIWRFTADRIADRPWLGWGMDASRALPGGDTNLAKLYPQAGLSSDATALPLHPHNAALQWRVELGVPGAALAVAIVLWGLWRVTRAAEVTRAARAGALAWSAAALVIGMLSYGAWQAWWLSSLWLTAALYAGCGVRKSPPTV